MSLSGLDTGLQYIQRKPIGTFQGNVFQLDQPFRPLQQAGVFDSYIFASGIFQCNVLTSGASLIQSVVFQ